MRCNTRPPRGGVPAGIGGILLALGGTQLACSDQDNQLTQLVPEIVVAPEALDFQGVTVPYSDVLELQVLNTGRAELQVSSVSVAGAAGDSGIYTVSPAALTVAADDSAPVLVTFEPDTYIVYETELVLASNDPAIPELRVPLRGEGVDGSVPEIALDRLSVDFGEVALGATVQDVFTITNAGSGPLEIDPSSALGESEVFSLVSDPAGQTLAAGASFPVVVEYSPADLDGDWTEYTIFTNDPVTPQATVALLGNGGGQYPVAVIDAPTDVAPLDIIVLDGSDSYDPAGYEPLTYHWMLFEQPASSSTEISDSAAAAPTTFIDAAGVYTWVLEVENSIGLVSPPASHTIAAVPSEDLYVLLSWNTGNSDLDLHLVQDTGDNYFIEPYDCCFCNPAPDWGDSGASEDDPLLALDNRVGYGPENINIADPAAGTYYIRVHYYQDYSGGDTEATVKVYVAGEEYASWSRVLSDDQVWEVAGISFPDAVLIDEDADPYLSPLDACE